MSSASSLETPPVRSRHLPRASRIVNRSNAFTIFASAFCVAFGLALIANTQTPNEGAWFWYSHFLGGGKRLYADMHLALQPLFVLETGGFIAVLGKGWLVSKVVAALHLVAYCLALILLVRQSGLSDARKAILLVCSFFVSISFEAYSFSDYHVLADCFVLYSLVALLSLRISSHIHRTLGLAATLGALSGLTVTTRLNDGVSLFIGAFLGVVCLAPSKRLLSLLVFCLSTGLTFLLVVSITGDSLHDYVSYSILNAAGPKGGAASALAQPLLLPWNTALWLKSNVAEWVIHSELLARTTVNWLVESWPARTLFYALVLALFWSLLLRPFSRRHGWWGRGLAVVGIVVIALQAVQLGFVNNIALLMNVAGLLVLLAFGLGIWVGARFILWLLNSKRAPEWDRREILLLIPLGQLASGSMSTGGTHLGLYGPVGVLVVLLAICSPIHFKAEWPWDTAFALASLLILCTVTCRFDDPFSWHTYREKPMFANRTWYRHPDYGPMIIDGDMLSMIMPVCQKVRDSTPDNELLSIPFPYANYFCSTPPWHGYVQTFFDTTSKQTVQNLIGELQHAPPKWIFYQRQLKNLREHEILYSQGQPLPQRYLDQLIEQMVTERTWRVAYTSDFGDGQFSDNKWILIQTR